MEIERKWRIDSFPDLPCSHTAEIFQGYLSLEPEIRIRHTVYDGQESFHMTYKSAGGLCRIEVEPEISEQEYRQLESQLEKPTVRKMWRGYDLPGGLLLEVSHVDPDSPTGFMYAEVEFESVEQADAFTAPDFLGEEMTGVANFKMGYYWAHRFDRNAPVVLASASPRRRELLAQLGVEFEVICSDADENTDGLTDPHEIVCTLAERKARAVELVPEAAGRTIIAADTIVVLDGKIYGKPVDAQDAKRMLNELSGRTHTVYTGVCILFADGRKEVFCEPADVTFGELSDQFIDAYIATGAPLDKAGSYGLQGSGAAIVKSINGDYTTVIGLPLHRVSRFF